MRTPEVAALLSSPKFIAYELARTFGFLAFQIQAVAVAWQVYATTNSALDLGYVGLALFLPRLLLSFLGGDLADRRSRSLLGGLGYIIIAFACLGLALATSSEHPASLSLIYALLVVIGIARAIGGPAGSAMLPQIVAATNLPQAIAISSGAWQLATIIGPSAGGFLFASIGAHKVHLWSALLFLLAGIVTILLRTPRPIDLPDNSMLDRLREGVRFVWIEKALLGALSLDLFAVLLGGAVALLPIYAKDILHVGPEGLGLLRSGPSIGAAVIAVWLTLVPIRHGAGRKMFLGVAVFGLATCVFALSTHFWLSMAALVVLGAADMISVVVRHSLVQLYTPDSMRGRVSAVNQVFIGASNELGEFESGLTAHWFGVVPAAVLGGVGTLVVAAIWWRRFPSLRQIDRLT